MENETKENVMDTKESLQEVCLDGEAAKPDRSPLVEALTEAQNVGPLTDAQAAAALRYHLADERRTQSLALRLLRHAFWEKFGKQTKL